MRSDFGFDQETAKVSIDQIRSCRGLLGIITGRRRRDVPRQPAACAHPEPGHETRFDLITRKDGKAVEIQLANDMIGEAATLEYIVLSLVVAVPIVPGVSAIS